MKKGVGVVIASYGYGHLASQAIESVLSQTRQPDSIFCVDDGAGDLRAVRAKYEDAPIKWVHREQNLGTVANFQDILLNFVDTDQVMFLGADNWLRPDTLEKLGQRQADIISYDIAVTGPIADAFCRRVGANEVKDGYRIWRFKPGNIERANFIHGSSLYSTKLAREVGGYEASGNRNSEEDWMLWRKMLKAGASYVHIPEPMLYYRRHKHNFIKERD